MSRDQVGRSCSLQSCLPLNCVSFDTGRTHTFLTLSIEGKQPIDLAADSKKHPTQCEDIDAQAPTLIDVDGDGFIDAEDVDILSQWFLF